MTEIQMWPFLISATPTSPYRILLWPGAQGFIGENQIMGLPSRADQGGGSSIFYPLIDGKPFTCITRYRRLTDADVEGAPLDERGRPIMIAEGVLAPGFWYVDEIAVWRLASPQITATLRGVWSHGAGWLPRDSQALVLPGTPAPVPTVTLPATPDPSERLNAVVPWSEPTEVPRPPGGGRVRRAGRFCRALVLALAPTLIVILTLVAYFWRR